MEHWVNVIVTEVIIGLTSSAIVGCIDVAQLSPLTTTRYVKTKWLYSIHSCATTHRDFFFPYQIGIYVNCFEADRNARLANWLNAGQGTFSLFMSSFFAGSSPSHPPLLQETLTYVRQFQLFGVPIFEESEKRFNDDGLLVRYARAMTSLTTTRLDGTRRRRRTQTMETETTHIGTDMARAWWWHSAARFVSWRWRPIRPIF